MLLAQLGRVPRAAVRFDLRRMPSSISTPSVAKSDSKPAHGLAGEVLVADERPVRVAIPEGADGVVDQPPEQDRLVDLIALVLGEVADLGLERRQVVAEEQRLVEEEREVVRPAEPLDAADEGCGMADQHDHLGVEARGEPLAREDRDRILQQRPRPAPAAGGEAAEILRRPADVARRADRRELPPQAVAEVEQCARSGSTYGPSFSAVT